MNYYPEYVVNAFNNALTCIYIIAALLFFMVIFLYVTAKYPEPIKALKKGIRLFLGLDKVVQTVYTDKTKNYSKTEFLPIPSKAPTNSFIFEFLGWNKFAREENGKFITEPIYLKTIKTFVVNVYDEQDNILETHEVEYGAGIKINHKKIIKESSKEFDYEFVGWDKETTAFYENSEIRPVFKAKPIKYTYKFVNNDNFTLN